jgi:hypothetical protein
MTIVKKPFFWSSCIVISWLLFEITFHNFSKFSLKKSILKFISEAKSSRYKKYYKIKFKNVKTHLNSIKDNEKKHVLESLSKSFSVFSIKDVIKQLNIHRSVIRKKCMFNLNYKNINSIFFYPLTFRFFVTSFNCFQLLNWKLKYRFNIIKYKKHTIYHIQPNNKTDKTIVIFIGLGGILQPFDNIIDTLIKSGYQIFIPIYGPSQASLNYNFECHEAEFNYDINDFILKNNIFEIEILSWSLGGLLYKGFEYIINSEKKIKINKVYLFEPLITLRGCMDMYFSQLRPFNSTVEIINKASIDKYFTYNKIFSYFMHTSVGYSTLNSFGCLTSIELVEDKENRTYPRYLFLSSDDIVINKKLDYKTISNNFDKENIFYRKGYHGGWLQSSRLLQTLKPLLTTS